MNVNSLINRHKEWVVKLKKIHPNILGDIADTLFAQKFKG
jgi:hypothetical protein